MSEFQNFSLFQEQVVRHRALYARPRILFLDEATSHLDSKVEASVHETLRKLDITRVVVAHRQGTISLAQRVIRLERETPDAIARTWGSQRQAPGDEAAA